MARLLTRQGRRKLARTLLSIKVKKKKRKEDLNSNIMDPRILIRAKLQTQKKKEKKIKKLTFILNA